jgi:hypothetical protein
MECLPVSVFVTIDAGGGDAVIVLTVVLYIVAVFVKDFVV